MSGKKVLVAYVIEISFLIIIQILSNSIFSDKVLLRNCYFYFEIIIDVILMMYLVNICRSFLLINICMLKDSIRKDLKNIFILITTYIISFLLTILSNIYISRLNISNYNQNALESNAQYDMLFSGLSAIVIAPIVEEIVFRGAIYGELRKKSILLAMSSSAFLFGLMHVWIPMIKFGHEHIISIVPYFILGLGMSITYERTKNFIYPLLFHIINNSFMYVMMQV